MGLIKSDTDKKYISKIRSKLGTDKFIVPAARIIIENNHDEILIIERADNGNIGIPAGGIEENETIEECIIREVLEETGLTILSLVVIGISSNPILETVEYPNGDCTQYLTIEFYSNKWEGTIRPQDTKEVRAARFADHSCIEKLPANEQSTFESLDYYRKTRKIMLK